MVDYHGVIRLLVKAFGVGLILYGISLAPPYLLSILDMVEAERDAPYLPALVSLITPFVLGLFLWLFPAPVANAVIPLKTAAKDAEWADQIERIAISVLGIYLLFRGVSHLAYYFGILVSVNGMDPASRANLGLQSVVTVVQIAIALFLIFRSPGITRLIRKLREAGVRT